MKFKAGLFDLDGTLIDSLPDIIDAVNIVRRELGLPVWASNAIRSWVGKGATYLIDGAIPEIPRQRVPECTQRYIDVYRNLPQPRTQLYPDVRETLSKLVAQGLRLGVVTNKSQVNAEGAVKKFLPDIPVDCIGSPETVSARKPHPAHLLEVLAVMKIAPQDAFFVGDDPVDKECAEAAGVEFFGAVYGIGVVEAPPSRRLMSFWDLLQAIR